MLAIPYLNKCMYVNLMRRMRENSIRTKQQSCKNHFLLVYRELQVNIEIFLFKCFQHQNSIELLQHELYQKIRQLNRIIAF